MQFVWNEHCVWQDIIHGLQHKTLIFDIITPILFFCIFLSFVLGAIVSVISFIRYENFLERMTYLFSYLKDCFLKGYFRYYYLDSEGKPISHSLESKSKIHLTIPIFFSVLLHVGGVL